MPESGSCSLPNSPRVPITSAATGERLDYGKLSDQLEEIREKLAGDNPDRAIQIIGFARLVGDLLDGLLVVMGFFAVPVLIATALLYWYTRCLRAAREPAGNARVLALPVAVHP